MKIKITLCSPFPFHKRFFAAADDENAKNGGIFISRILTFKRNGVSYE